VTVAIVRPLPHRETPEGARRGGCWGIGGMTAVEGDARHEMPPVGRLPERRNGPRASRLAERATLGAFSSAPSVAGRNAHLVGRRARRGGRSPTRTLPRPFPVSEAAHLGVLMDAMPPEWPCQPPYSSTPSTSATRRDARFASRSGRDGSRLFRASFHRSSPSAGHHCTTPSRGSSSSDAARTSKSSDGGHDRASTPRSLTIRSMSTVERGKP
jgi:hypothetical protein